MVLFALSILVTQELDVLIFLLTVMMTMSALKMSALRAVVVCILKRIAMTRTLALLIHVMMVFVIISFNTAMMKMLVLRMNVIKKLESASTSK
uniref:Ion transport domain-containing protein n=1 Tax=Arcella intermedia TaxID=1963864 RepID=A0A6B2LHY6_9EUKA